jgi:hypothetical protein
MRKLIGGLILGVFLVSGAQLTRASDNPVFPTGPIFQLKNLVWGQTGPNGFNNNFFFTPLSVNESVCVLVYNNNTTNSHPFSMSITISGDPANKTPSDGTWQPVASTGGGILITSPVSPGIAGGLGASVSGGAQVSINFSLSSTLAGAPDTANVTITQTQGTCLSGNNIIGSNAATIALPGIVAYSESLGQSYFATSGLLTNPASGINVLQIIPSSTSRSLYFYKATVSCSAACSITIGYTTTFGSTCTTVPVSGLRISSTVTSTATANQLCTVVPGLNAISNINLAAGVPYDFDPAGLIASPNSGGFEVFLPTGFTGTIAASIRWYEK